MGTQRGRDNLGLPQESGSRDPAAGPAGYGQMQEADGLYGEHDSRLFAGRKHEIIWSSLTAN